MKKSFEDFLREKCNLTITNPYLDKGDLIKLAEEWHKSQEKSVEEIADHLAFEVLPEFIATGEIDTKNLAAEIHKLIYGEKK